ncbi:hypothetical protein THAOC_14885, partial [Thalassiosira oceanica]
VRDGGSFFQIRGSRARGDEEDGPPRRRRKVQLEYPDGSTYVGEALDGKRDGRGKVTFANGYREEGIFVDGVLREGKATYTDGHVEEGVFVDGFLNGRGKITFADGTVQEGVFINGWLREGKVTSAADGEVHEGVFVDGCLREGKVTFADGEVHEGVFENNGLHGPGKITLTDGCEIEGDFAHGKLVQGTITNAELANGGTYTGQVTRIPSDVDGRSGFVPNGTGKKTKNGEVHEGVFGVDGFKGKVTCANGEVNEGVFDVDDVLREGKITFADEEVHEGVFDVGGLREGKITFPPEGRNGEVKKEGVFVNGRLNGRGKITYADGEVHEGDFVNGCLNGRGKITFADGEVHEGDFVNVCLNGHGKLTYDDGGIIKGTFVDGYIDAGTAENVKCDDGNIYTGEIVGGLPTGSLTTWLCLPNAFGPTGAASLIDVFHMHWQQHVSLPSFTSNQPRMLLSSAVMSSAPSALPRQLVKVHLVFVGVVLWGSKRPRPGIGGLSMLRTEVSFSSCNYAALSSVQLRGQNRRCSRYRRRRRTAKSEPADNSALDYTSALPPWCTSGQYWPSPDVSPETDAKRPETLLKLTCSNEPPHPTINPPQRPQPITSPMTRTLNAEKRQKVAAVESALFNPDVVFLLAVLLDARDICQVSLTCKTLGGKRASDGDGLSLVEEAVRRLFECASEWERSCLPKYPGEGWVELHHHLLMLRSKLTFFQLVGSNIEHGEEESIIQMYPWPNYQSDMIFDGIQSNTPMGLLLDLEEGMLSIYQNGQRLATLKDGLSGEYCWFAAIWGTTRSILIERGLTPGEQHGMK